MLTFDFTTADLARTRFAMSPMWEVIAGLRLLSAPDRAGPHLPWVREALPLTREVDVSMALALLPAKGYIPDFLTPPPTTPLAAFADELDLVRATPRDLVMDDARWLTKERGRSARLRALIDDPARGLDALAEALEAWWELAVEPHWPRIKSVLDADLAYRARRLTEGGPAELFADLDRETTWRGDRLEVDMAFEGRSGLDGRGLVIVPSAFGWHRSSAMEGGNWQPTLFYPARGLELLWEPGASAPDALAGVLGRGRADLLAHLEAPRSTTELARRLEVSPGGVSQHLGALKAAGLVTSSRRGREVLYLRTELAERLDASARA